MPKPAPRRQSSALSHVGPDGLARMVDVGEKPVTARRAVAEGFVCISSELARAIRANALAKGNVLDVARLAGIAAAKRTSDLIPLCHPLPLDAVHVDARLVARAPGGSGPAVAIRAEACCHARTGVEMEALTAVAAAALTVIDMGKAIDKGMVIEGVRMVEKSGGRSGTYRAPPPARPRSQA